MTDYIYVTLSNHPERGCEILHACDTVAQADAFIRTQASELLPYINVEWLNESINEQLTSLPS